MFMGAGNRVMKKCEFQNSLKDVSAFWKTGTWDINSMPHVYLSQKLFLGT